MDTPRDGITSDKAEHWLNLEIGRGFITRPVEISPRVAQLWLDRKAENRKMSEAEVVRQLLDIAAGRFALGHQGVAFNADGQLVDGQHRLEAIKRSGMTVWILVTVNESREAATHTDRQRRRSLAEIGQLNYNLSGKPEHFAVLRALFSLHGGRQVQMSDLAWLELFGRYEKAIVFAHDVLKTAPGGIANAHVKAPIARASLTENHEALRHFAQVLIDGVMLHDGDRVAVVLRNALLETGYTSKMVSRKRYRLTERALLSYLRNEPVRILREMDRELFPIPEDQDDDEGMGIAQA